LPLKNISASRSEELLRGEEIRDEVL